MNDTVWIVWAEGLPTNTPVIGAFASESEATAYAQGVDENFAEGARVTPLALPFVISHLPRQTY